MSLHLAGPEHEIAFKDVCELISRHADKLTALELLAVAANMVGKLVALQDQRSVTPDMAMEIVALNLEHGNQQALGSLAETKGSA